MKPSSSRGFTLIELLVVIAIISLLVSILMPSLKRAKYLTLRTMCASNQHNLGLGMHQYNMEYGGLPIGHYGYLGQHKWGSYMMNWGNSPEANMLLGKLWHGELAVDGRLFYCPLESEDERLMYNTEYNTWPPEEGTTFCRSSYATRPSISWNHFWWPNNMPELPSSLPAQTAMLSDYVFGPDSLNRHPEGVNVSYGDGSTHWVEVERFQESLDDLPTGLLVNVGAAYDEVYLSDDGESGLWADFDR